MGAHTPGPWEAQERDERVVLFADGFHDEMASFPTLFDCDTEAQADAVAEEQIANATMAAAAPEMFAALQKVPLRHDRRCRALPALYDNGDLRDEAACDCWVTDVRAAIAKAVGK